MYMYIYKYKHSNSFHMSFLRLWMYPPPSISITFASPYPSTYLPVTKHGGPPVILPPPRVWTPPDPCCILKRAGWSGEWKVELLMGVFWCFFGGGEIQKVFYFGLKILDDLKLNLEILEEENGETKHGSYIERWVEFFWSKSLSSEMLRRVYMILTLPKTNMAGWKISIFNRKCISWLLKIPMQLGSIPSLKLT